MSKPTLILTLKASVIALREVAKALANVAVGLWQLRRTEAVFERIAASAEEKARGMSVDIDADLNVVAFGDLVSGQEQKPWDMIPAMKTPILDNFGGWPAY